MKVLSSFNTSRLSVYKPAFCFLVCLLAVVVAISFPHASAGQKQERTLKHKKWNSEPIRIMGVKAKGHDIPLDEKIFDADDWFQGLTIKVKNISNKAIVFVEFGTNLFTTRTVSRASSHWFPSDIRTLKRRASSRARARG